jgi:hypothetical protein
MASVVSSVPTARRRVIRVVCQTQHVTHLWTDTEVSTTMTP